MLLAFLVEVAMLILLGHWGYHLFDNMAMKILFAVLAPLVAAILWAIFAAPKSKTRLKQPLLLVFKLVMFIGTAILLYWSGHIYIAAALTFFGLLNQSLSIITND
jgi:hypothetical protein